MTALRVTVLGTPAPQGSKKGFVVNGSSGPRAVVVDANKKPLRTWREDVKQAAVDGLAGRPPADGPMEVTIVYRLRRPQSHYGRRGGQPYLKPTAPVHVATKPDLDKLDRAILDALTAAGVWHDDNQAARLMVEKVYADPGLPGADITVTPIALDVATAAERVDQVVAGDGTEQGLLL